MSGAYDRAGCRGGNDGNSRDSSEEGKRSGPCPVTNPHHRCILIAEPSAARAEERFSPPVS